MLAKELENILKGDVLTDDAALAHASRDASIFEMKPEVVVQPKDAEDVKALVRFATKKKEAGESISLTARSGGTDMTGGTLTQSVVVDFAKYLNKFISIHSFVIPAQAGIQTELDSRLRGNDREKQISGTASVQPGMFYRDFEKETLKEHLLMPSYPASRELCTVGGMVANNAGGEKTLFYGKTEEYLAELKVVLADGEEHVIKPLNAEELREKLKAESYEGDLYRKIYKLIDEHYEAIMAAKPDVSKNSAGYYLWNVWDKEKGVFDLTKLIVGSQGTLGLVTEITFKLVRPKPHSLMAVVFLKDIAPVADVTNVMLKYQPESLECYDDKTLKLAIRFFPSILKRVKGSRIKFLWSFLPDLWMLIKEGGFPKLVIMAELTGESEAEIRPRLRALEKALLDYDCNVKVAKKPFHRRLLVHLTKHQAEEDKYWITRRESFSLLRSHVKGKHTLPVIDDVVVKPEHLPAFLPELEAILAKYNTKLVSTIAGHNGNGNFHVIPLMDFKDPEARAIIPKLMDEVYDLVLRYKGSITAEHNDGLIRTPYLEKMYGSKITALFREVKKIFDPLGILNPGKKVPVEGETIPKLLQYIQKD
jgi:FAD/FMN-containing dehydrogenase